jgi:hypothetical protein
MNLATIAEDGRALVQVAVVAAENITSQVRACGVANFANFWEVGNCLNKVYAYARTIANDFIVKLTNIVSILKFTLTIYKR